MDPTVETSRLSWIKVFWFFFAKKNCFLCAARNDFPARARVAAAPLKVREGKRFFFEKKNQKTFAPGGLAVKRVMRWVLAFVWLLLAGWQPAQASAMAMPCHQAVGSAPQPHPRGTPMTSCAVDCPMHGGALIRTAPVAVIPVRVARACFAPVAAAQAAGWSPAPLHGPPRLGA